MADLVEQLSDVEKAARDDLTAALKLLLDTAEGRTVIMWVLREGNVYADPFAADNHAATDYRLGQQSIARRVLIALDDLDPRAYPTLLLEAANDRAMKLAAAAANKDETDELEAP